ncbi:polyketide synthase dehydratase domain-containing protein, partial [Actinocorallia lasiicapitis]
LLGLAALDHPLLGAAVTLPDTGGLLFTGRVSLADQPWLADHAVLDAVLLPGTAFVELAVRAGEETGCPAVEELTLQAPLVLQPEGGVDLQVKVDDADDTGRRPVSIRSCHDGVWTLHAQGTLTEPEEPAPAVPTAWPPPGAVALPVEGTYEHLLSLGYAYGPVFQGLRAAWRSGDDVYAEVELAAGQPATGPSYLLHPALFDSALQTALAPVLDREDGVFLPFVLRGVRVHTPAARSLRVKLSFTGRDTVSLSATDETGAAVASIDSLALRQVDTRQLTAAGQSSRLLRLDWKRVPLTPAAESPAADGHWAHLGTDHLGLTGALKAAHRQMGTYPSLHSLDAALRDGDPVPDVFIVSCTEADGESGVAARTAVERALVLVQELVTDDRLTGSRLVVVTRGAVAAAQDEGCPDLAGAAVWGLVRSAQTEYPDRFVLLDLDDEESSEQALGLAVATGEPQLAIRRGAL